MLEFFLLIVIYAIVPLNVKATSLNCSLRLLNQPQSTNVKHWPPGVCLGPWWLRSLLDKLDISCFILL